MPTVCMNCRCRLDRERNPDARALRIEYQATMEAMEALLHHYRVLALRLERLAVEDDQSYAE